MFFFPLMADDSGLNRERIARRFEWSVRSLALPAHLQLNLFPDFTCKADELALEFDEWRRAFLDSGAGTALPPEQTRLIAKLDAQLARMSGQQNAGLWEEAALEQCAEWARVRTLAADLIRTMGWNPGPPPIDRGDMYVAG